MKLSNLVCASVMGFLSAQIQAADIFTYRLPGWPMANNAQGCDAELSVLNTTLEQDFGVEIYSSQCTPSAIANYSNIEINYIADAKLNVVSTISQSITFSYGAYSKLEDCEADIADEKAAFNTHTGLEPFVAYCQALEVGYRGGWALRIEGIGETGISPHTMVDTTARNPLIGKEALIERITQSERSDLKVSRVRFEPDLGADILIVNYYAPERIWFSPRRILDFSTEEDCLAIDEEAHNILLRANKPALVAYCGKMFGDITLDILKEDGPGSIRTEQDPQGFASISECQSSQQTTEDTYRNRLGRDVFGSLCAKTSSGIKMLVFSNIALPTP